MARMRIDPHQVAINIGARQLREAQNGEGQRDQRHDARKAKCGQADMFKSKTDRTVIRDPPPQAVDPTFLTHRI